MRRSKNWEPKLQSDLADELGQLLVGQAEAIKVIVPYIRMYQAGLCPAGRPVAVFLLLGPTGTGKTRTVEALAEVLHGKANKLTRIDCGEFQLDHEVAKLIGAPPGYLGHRETTPLLTSAKLLASTSDRSDISIVLFDEIEKAAPSLTRLLLGVLDKATLRLGDNTSCNFEKSVIFMTSNLGTAAMTRAVGQQFGLGSVVDPLTLTPEAIHKMGAAAVKRQFSPEFVNRIDRSIGYVSLTPDALTLILEQQLSTLQGDIDRSRKENSITLDVSPKTRKFLLKTGTSAEYGARELKRTIHRELMQPLASVLLDNSCLSRITIRVDMNGSGDAVVFKAASAA